MCEEGECVLSGFGAHTVEDTSIYRSIVMPPATSSEMDASIFVQNIHDVRRDRPKLNLRRELLNTSEIILLHGQIFT